MKNVLLHLPNCQMGRNCTIQHCASSRQIIAHWKQCKRPDCAVCQPLKPPVNNPGGAGANQQNPNQPGGPDQQSLHQPNPNQQGPDQANRPNPADQANQPGNQPNAVGGPAGQNPANRPGQPGQVGATPGGATTGNQPDWRAEVNQELREHLVKKLVSAIFPTTDSNERNSNDDRIKKLYNFARKVEEYMYTKANTREEYYHMLAEKIYKIQKELEAKRRARLMSAPFTTCTRIRRRVQWSNGRVKRWQ